ncbi:hypothetical protein FGO68_gene6690 [Halteria grandinella]|uniref:Uncharacterized protein n=1 Tax=Halteria grandinella TaxID=5974 RepID=A0A8J8SZ21_HALGN|nr:hypothetical protein FGO68_gene6690 [Halteria grandinella]
MHLDGRQRALGESEIDQAHNSDIVGQLIAGGDPFGAQFIGHQHHGHQRTLQRVAQTQLLPLSKERLSGSQAAAGLGFSVIDIGAHFARYQGSQTVPQNSSLSKSQGVKGVPQPASIQVIQPAQQALGGAGDRLNQSNISQPPAPQFPPGAQAPSLQGLSDDEIIKFMSAAFKQMSAQGKLQIKEIVNAEQHHE